MLFQQSERGRRLLIPAEREDRDLDREHRDITDAVLSRDANAVVERMSARFDLKAWLPYT